MLIVPPQSRCSRGFQHKWVLVFINTSVSHFVVVTHFDIYLGENGAGWGRRWRRRWWWQWWGCYSWGCTSRWTPPPPRVPPLHTQTQVLVEGPRLRHLPNWWHRIAVRPELAHLLGRKLRGCWCNPTDVFCRSSANLPTAILPLPRIPASSCRHPQRPSGLAHETSGIIRGICRVYHSCLLVYAYIHLMLRDVTWM